MRVPLKIQISPKSKAWEKFASIRYADCLLTPLRRAAYGLYVSKKFFPQRSSWDEIWILRGARDC
jgi:hypothetical protein